MVTFIICLGGLCVLVSGYLYTTDVVNQRNNAEREKYLEEKRRMDLPTHFTNTKEFYQPSWDEQMR